MKLLAPLLILLLLSGCSTTGYIVKQGWGQLKLQWSGVSNEKILADASVSDDIKFKLRLIEDAKRFFEHYFNLKVGGIYSKTSMLDSEAVTWLVIASRPDRVEAHEFEFPFVGSFPYIGFFSKDDAESFRLGLEEEGKITYMRPVYAYSTLGHLEDRVLSSFFHFNEIELVELVFHELFHVAFFVKDEVELNENLAQWFANALLDEYFKDSTLLEKYRKTQAGEKKLEQKLVQLGQLLREEFAKMQPNLSDEKANAHAARFVTEILVPVIQDACQEAGWNASDCPDDPKKWNQARLAAILTYEEEQSFINAVALRHNFKPRDFLAQLKAWYKEWDKSHKDGDEFNLFLKKKT